MSNEFYLSQSAVKDLEREGSCPFRWKSQWIDRNPDLQFSNEYTLKGKFFEQLVLGSSAHENSPVTDLPRLLNGEKSTDQIRIERQAARVKAWIEGDNELGLIALNTQLKLEWDGDQGTIDLVLAEKINPRSVWVTDLKLTRDLTSTRSLYSYGNDWAKMDQLQLSHYGWLFEMNKGVKPKLALLVADYSPKERIEFGEIILGPRKAEERGLRFGEVKEAIKWYSANGWITIPSVKECKSCKLDCKDRVNET